MSGNPTNRALAEMKRPSASKRWVAHVARLASASAEQQFCWEVLYIVATSSDGMARESECAPFGRFRSDAQDSLFRRRSRKGWLAVDEVALENENTGVSPIGRARFSEKALGLQEIRWHRGGNCDAVRC